MQPLLAAEAVDVVGTAPPNVFDGFILVSSPDIIVLLCLVGDSASLVGSAVALSISGWLLLLPSRNSLALATSWL